MDDNVIFYGDRVFATKTAEGVKLGGYLVRFGNPDETDLTGDYFTKDTDFGNATEADVWLNHRFPVKVGKRQVEYTDRISKATLRTDDYGVFAETLIAAHDEYVDAIVKAGMAGKLGWSSGTAAHLVDRKQVGNAWEITRWPLGLDASLTPTPAEPRNIVMSIKSLSASAEGTNNEIKPTPKQEENKMDELNLEALKASFAELATAAATNAAEQAVKKFAESQEPEVKAGRVSNVVDEADRAAEGNPFKSAGEYFSAVKNAALMPHAVDKRLLPLKATGANEAIPSQGGFLVQQDISTSIWELMHPVGSLLSRFSAIPVQGNGIVLPAVDETSRADGSRLGGITSAWMAEGGSYSASKPKFRTIDIKLNKVGSLVVATDEVLEDTRALEAWIMANVPNEMRFMVENAIFRGDGVGKPLGILNSGALQSVVRTDAAEIDNLDIGRMWAARWQGVNDYVWLASPTIFPQLMNMTIGQMPVYTPPSGLDAAPYGQLLGRPVIETEYSPSLGVVGDLLLVSPSQYALITKGGIKAESSIHVYFSTGEQAFRFNARFGGQPYWYTTLASYYASTDTFSPFVALAATT